MNASAFKAIKEPANVTLLYWRPREGAGSGELRSGAIGVKYPVAADRNFFPVRRYGRGRKMRIVRGGRLLKQFGLELERTLSWTDPEMVEFRGEPMLVLWLDAGRPV